MLTVLRRFLVLTGLLFWQGGFLFYSAVVVPIGQDMLGVTQGFLTRRVTIALNVAGVAALVPMLVDVVAGADPLRRRRRLRLLAAVGMALALGVLFWMHPRLDVFLDVDLQVVEDTRGFRPWHRWYLWISTIQWALGVLYMFLMVPAWRDEDRLTLSARPG